MFSFKKSKYQACKKGVRNCTAGSLCGEQDCRGGSPGSKPRENAGICGTSRPGDRRMLVTDENTGKVVRRETTIPLEFMRCGGKGQIELMSHTSIAVNSANNIIVGDASLGHIHMFNSKKNLVATIICRRVAKVAVHPITDEVVAVTTLNEVIRYSKYLKLQLNTKGLNIKEKSDVEDIAVDDDGNILLVRTGERCMEIYNTSNNGNVIFCQGLFKPVSVAAYKKNIYVVDAHESLVKMYDYKGYCQLKIGGYGMTPNPFAVRVTTAGVVVVGGNFTPPYDVERHQLTLFSAYGHLLEAYQDVLKHHNPCLDMAVYYDDSNPREKNNVLLCNRDEVKLYRY